MKATPDGRHDWTSEHIAVIAVHGVGDPGAGSTVQSIVTLLSRLFRTTPAGIKTVYTPFTSSGLTISNRPAPIPKAGHRAKLRTFAPGAERLGAKDFYEVDNDPIRFIGSQLSDYHMEDGDRTYTTFKHEGYRRNPTTGQEALKVDVYELYWADLIRISSGVLGFFTDLYQLIFHVTHLASKSVAATRKNIPQGYTKTWWSYEFIATVASRYLAVMVFFYNVWLLPIVLVTTLLFAAKLNGAALAFIALVAVMAAWALSSWGSATTAKWKTQVALTVLLGAAVGVLGLEGQLRYFEKSVLGMSAATLGTLHWVSAAVASTLVLAAISALIFSFIRKFNLGNPNAAWPALIVGVVTWVAWLYPLVDAMNVKESSLHTLLFLTVLGDVNYAILLGLELLAIVLGIAAWLQVRGTPQTDEAGRVFFTSVLGLGLPTVLFSVATIPIWTMFTRGILATAFKGLYLDGAAKLLLDIASIGFGWTALIACMAFVLAVVLLFPSILAEGLFFKSEQRSSNRLATWVTSGAVSVPIMVLMLFVGATIPVVFFSIWFATGSTSFSFSASVLMGILAGLGVIVLVLKDQAGPWTSAFGPILNKALDVDGYLRQNPKERTPKARIFCRYTSLLRYIFSHPANYKKVVILAHSQGTIITADLLKYLMDSKIELDPVLLRQHDGKREFLKPISLFTMGCPLRQLYSERFPAWYDWARSANVVTRPVPPASPALAANIAPIQELLGLSHWSNAYGSGDYIGRALWRGVEDPDFAVLPSPSPSWDVTAPVNASTKPDGATREFCIGPLAHTRYWDEPGDAIARELDALIA
ncbi:MAG TPA: hypothetical protein VL981_05335 [Candidatus Methylacidiphilales bacterium]|nr:hypothetical protein [Candidatus Methylacidiphilales bacterium]